MDKIGSGDIDLLLKGLSGFHMLLLMCFISFIICLVFKYL